ncbi:MAG TPA: hypothetical protein VJ909_03395 [Prolixibacteraceae bacterium]|nr:hypothetical protein [Prolixibacteraceae bacterium]
MKKILLSLWTVGILFFYACETEVHITNPTLFTTPEDFIALDTISHEIIADGEIDGVPVEIENYEWIITHESGDTIEIISQEANTIKWLPQNSGYYQIEVVLSVENKSLREIDRLYIVPYTARIWDYIIGTWKVTGKIGSEYKWISTFEIVEKGIFTCKIDNIISGDVKSSLGKIGNDDITPTMHTDRYIGRFSILGKNSYNGWIKYWDGEIDDPYLYSDGKISSMSFFDNFNKIEMTAIFNEWLNTTRPVVKDTVYFEMIKQH